MNAVAQALGLRKANLNMGFGLNQKTTERIKLYIQ
jgi:hypothetical protein